MFPCLDSKISLLRNVFLTLSLKTKPSVLTNGSGHGNLFSSWQQLLKQISFYVLQTSKGNPGKLFIFTVSTYPGEEPGLFSVYSHTEKHKFTLIQLSFLLCCLLLCCIKKTKLISRLALKCSCCAVAAKASSSTTSLNI